MLRKQMRSYLIETGQTYIVLNGLDFLDAISDEQAEQFQQMIFQYREQRAAACGGDDRLSRDEVDIVYDQLRRKMLRDH